jgi:imidazolonepropionase-like amidohydrolase
MRINPNYRDMIFLRDTIDTHLLSTVAGAVVAVVLALCTAESASAQDGDLVIRNATVLTVTNGSLQATDILIREGRIAAIGADLPAGNVDEIDATGKFVMPGIIDAHSHIALSSINESTNEVTPEVTMEDSVDPFDVGIYRALAGGVTTAHLMHGSANVIGGQNETIKLRYGARSPDELRFEGAPRTIKFALGENPTRVHGSTGHPSTRMGVELVLRNTFEEGKRYMEAWDEWDARRNKEGAVSPEYDLRLETIADILRGEILVHSHSYRADEILMLMNVLRDYGIERVTFQHANEAFKVAPELAEFGAMASVFADWWAYKFEVYYSTAYNATILTRNGVTASINSDDGGVIRHLYHEAAKTKRYGGLSDEEALRLITINPATQLGVDDRIGSLEVGKDADLAIFSAHPLSIYAVNEKTIVDGVVRFDRVTDADDQRILVDPDEEIPETSIAYWQTDMHQCLQNTEWLFGAEAVADFSW